MEHHHSRSVRGVGIAARRARIILAAITLPILAATVAGLIALWPTGDAVHSVEDPFGETPIMEATVIRAEGQRNEFGSEVEVEFATGGTGQVQVPPEILDFGIHAGDRIQVIELGDEHFAGPTGSPYVFVDFVRGPAMFILFAMYLGVVGLVARVRGLFAVVGLAGGAALVVFFLAPALMEGAPVVLTTVVAASAMMFLAVYLAHGISIRTTTALLGTFAGLLATCGLAVWAVGGTRLTGAGSDEPGLVAALLPGVSFRELLIGGLILAGLGALNDVTITQASSVWELHSANPTLTRRALFAKGMRIGRDHIASTIYTLAFAYLGVALPLVLVIMVFDRPMSVILTSPDIAGEIVRTLVSSIGLILAIPLTTALAVFLVSFIAAREPARTQSGTISA